MWGENTIMFSYARRPNYRESFSICMCMCVCVFICGAHPRCWGLHNRKDVSIVWRLGDFLSLFLSPPSLSSLSYTLSPLCPSVFSSENPSLSFLCPSWTLQNCYSMLDCVNHNIALIPKWNAIRNVIHPILWDLLDIVSYWLCLVQGCNQAQEIWPICLFQHRQGINADQHRTRCFSNRMTRFMKIPKSLKLSNYRIVFM